MRTPWLALASLLVWQATGWAQQPPAQLPQTPAVPVAPAAAPLDPGHNPLDGLLVNWEGAMVKVESISAQCSRVDENKTFGATKVFVGRALYLKPNLGLLEMWEYQKGKPTENFEKIVVNGSMVYQYIQAQKQVVPTQMPTPKGGQMAEDNFLAFLFGMKAQEAKRRYDIRMVEEKRNDPYYFYLDVLPRSDGDKADFKRARLVLNKDSYMPRQLWFERPNGDTVTWDIPKVQAGANLNKDDFKPVVPKDWKMMEVQRPLEQPRIIRQGGQ
jgi:TIGR03009 family protein